MTDPAPASEPEVFKTFDKVFGTSFSPPASEPPQSWYDEDHSALAGPYADESKPIADRFSLAVETITSLRLSLATLTDERDALAARLAKAEEVLAKLPKTAGGVPIVPGMTVWVLANPVDHGTILNVGKGMVEVHRESSIVWRFPNETYESEAAARAALESRGG